MTTYRFDHWVVNGKNYKKNPLTLLPTAPLTKVEAYFKRRGFST